MMPNADPLAGLRDVHLPDPVGLWPPAPGWWIAALVLVAAAVAIAWRRRARRGGPDHEALALVDDLDARFARDGDRVALATDLSRLLRRIALVRFDRREVAGLHGAARARAMTAADAPVPIPVELIERLEAVVYAGEVGDVAPDEPRGWIESTRAFVGAPVGARRRAAPGEEA